MKPGPPGASLCLTGNKEQPRAHLRAGGHQTPNALSWTPSTRHSSYHSATMSQKDKLAAPPVLRSGSEPAVVEETPVRASADSAEAFEEERAVMPADESDAAEVARLRRKLHAKDAAEIARLRQELCAKDAAAAAQEKYRIKPDQQIPGDAFTFTCDSECSALVFATDGLSGSAVSARQFPTGSRGVVSLRPARIRFSTGRAR